MKISTKISLWLAAGLLILLAAAGVVVDYVESEQIKNRLIDEGMTAAMAGAASTEAILNLGIARGEIALSELLDPKFGDPIKWMCEQDGKHHVVPPRYHVGWDTWTDTSGLTQIQDTIMAAGHFGYSSVMTRIGYVPTALTEYDQEPVCDVECTDSVTTNCGHDIDYSRQKQIYDGQEQLQAAASLNPGYLPYPRKGKKGWAIDVFAPITLARSVDHPNGKHFGAFRVGVLLDAVGEHHRLLTNKLVWLFSIISVLIITMLYVVINWKFTRLRSLASHMLWLGTTDNPGRDLAVPIKFKRRKNGDPVDELDQMAKGAERMRMSLHGAMERLDGKSKTVVIDLAATMVGTE